MANYRFLGRILPSIANLNLGYKISTVSHGWDFDAKIEVEIENSVVRVDCTVDDLQRPDMGELFRRCQLISRAPVDLISFSTGQGLVVFFETFTDSNGVTSPLNLHYPGAAQICTAFSFPEPHFEEALGILIKEPDLWKIVSDLTDTIVWVDRILINSARAVEAIRVLIDPQVDRNKSWETMRTTLRLSRDYIQMITSHSEKQRHGHYIGVDAAIGSEVRQRAWQITNRFIEFKRRNVGPLPAAGFPLL